MSNVTHKIKALHDTPGMDAKSFAERPAAQCGKCRYFQEDQQDTGYCQVHRAYVLVRFACDRFLPKTEQMDVGTSVQAGALSTEQR